MTDIKYKFTWRDGTGKGHSEIVTDIVSAYANAEIFFSSGRFSSLSIRDLTWKKPLTSDEPTPKEGGHG